MYIDLHHSSIDLNSAESLKELHEALVYDGIRLAIISLSSTNYKERDIKEGLFNLTVSAKEYGYKIVQTKNDLHELETNYIPKLGFHFEISSSFLKEMNPDEMTMLALYGVRSINFAQNISEKEGIKLLKQSWFKNKFIVNLKNTKQEAFSEILSLLADSAYTDIDALHPNEEYSNSAEGLKSLFDKGGKACLTFQDLHHIGLPGTISYAKKIKELVDTFGSENFCISTDGNDLTKNRDKVSPFSVLRTELLRLGMSDKNLDNIFFKTTYDFLNRSLS